MVSRVANMLHCAAAAESRCTCGLNDGRIDMFWTQIDGQQRFHRQRHGVRPRLVEAGVVYPFKRALLAAARAASAAAARARSIRARCAREGSPAVELANETRARVTRLQRGHATAATAE